MAFLGGILGQTVFVIFSLTVLYYFYQYLFAYTGQGSKLVLNGTMSANPTNALVSSVTDKANAIPAIYEGGEYSVNIWVYINDWSTRRGYNKHIVSIGGNDFLTFALYLKPFTNALAVTVRTTDLSTTPASGSVSQATSTPNAGDLLTGAGVQTLFNSASSMPQDITTTPPCDIPSIDLQKWVQVTLTLNNKTSDVYIDGKLARSCVLPSFYRVSKTGSVSMKICDFGGFGGYVSNATAFNYTLNPEQVWQHYMKGPGPQYSFTDYWNGLFNPTSINTNYPKMNIVG